MQYVRVSFFCFCLILGGFLAASVAVGWAQEELVSLDVRDGDLRAILQNLAVKGKINLIMSPKVRGTVTCRLQDMAPREIIEFLVRANGFVLEDNGRIILIMGEPSSGGKIRFEVISLKNANAREVEKIIQTLKLDKRSRVTHDARTNRIIIVYDQ